MEAYNLTKAGTVQALDFTSRKKTPSKADSHEPPVLDLSCKKQPVSPAFEPGRSSPLELRSSTPTGTDGLQQLSFADLERKSPFEGRSFMVTPPSESDSPKKPKFESIYNCLSPAATNIALPSTPLKNLSPVTLPVPIVPSALPNLLAQNTNAVRQLQIIGAPATSTTAPAVAPPDTSKKAPRPFKAYPKDPLSFTMGPSELIYDQNSKEAYSEFRKRMLESVRKSSEGTNVKMRRSSKSPGLPTSTVEEKDAAYWERRRKNNEAAKRSRDARRAKEDEIAIRAAFLEQENIKLKYELVALRNETAKLRCMVYST